MGRIAPVIQMNRKHIGIISWGAMADVLYVTPVVRHIRLMNPNAHITWLIRDKFAEVVETNPDVDHIETFTLPEGYSSRQEAEHAMDKEILAYAHSMHEQVYDLQYWPRFNNFYERRSEDFISLRARNANINPHDITDRSIELCLTEDNTLRVDRFISEFCPDEDFITVNHISYAASPVWPFSNYEQLVEKLESRGISCVFTGAPNEPIPAKAIDARGMPYREWAGVIGESKLWLGLDSGAVALAASTETPIIKLHSPDFPLAKTGVVAMGLRTDNVFELCPAPSVDAMTELIMENIS